MLSPDHSASEALSADPRPIGVAARRRSPALCVSPSCVDRLRSLSRVQPLVVCNVQIITNVPVMTASI